jgi:hypothetical protein
MKLSMKFLNLLLSFVLLSNIFFTSSTYAQGDEPRTSTESGKVDIYAVFWPIVPGTTVADSSFFFKQLKEGLSGMFKFSTLSKADYQIGISEKRLVEASKLIESKDYANGLKSISLNEDARKSALELKKKAVEEKADTLELTNKLVKSFENQQKALIYLATQLPEDQKSKLDQILKNLPLQISEAK